MVGIRRLELPRVAPLVPETSASTNSAICPLKIYPDALRVYQFARHFVPVRILLFIRTSLCSFLYTRIPPYPPSECNFIQKKLFCKDKVAVCYYSSVICHWQMTNKLLTWFYKIRYNLHKDEKDYRIFSDFLRAFYRA